MILLSTYMTDMEDDIRKQILKLRTSKSPEDILRKSAIIQDILISTTEYVNAKNILCYADCRGEVKTGGIIDDAINKGKKVFLPLCEEDYSMNFYSIDSMEDCVIGYYGITEPKACDEKRFSQSDFTRDTLIIVPGVVFDRNHNRMGYSKGYYDRFLARFDGIDKIALAFEFQIVDEICANPWDVLMDKIITENGII